MVVAPVLDAYGCPALDLRFWGPDVRTGRGVGWHATNLYPIPACRSIDEQLGYVLSLHEIQAIHEAREAFTFNWQGCGVRVFDPHRGPSAA